MRIVMVAHSFPPYIGGLSYVVENISTRLAERGFDVEVVTLDVDGGLPGEEEYRGVAVRRFRGYAPDGGYFIPGPGFYRYIRGVEADIVHLHNIGALTVPVAYHALRGRGYVLTPHHHRSGYKWHARLLWRLYRPVAGRVVRGADVVHCVSEYEASLVRETFNAGGVVVVPNGVSDDVFNYMWSPPRGRVTLTYAGRVEGYKRVDVLVRAAGILKRRGLGDVAVKVIGRGPGMRRVLDTARRLEVYVESKGFLPRGDYLRELSSTTVFVNPSEYEAYSIVSAEAIAMGVPTIVAKPWGEHFRGIRGVFIVEPDPGVIAGIVEEVVGGRLSSNQGPHSIPGWGEVVDRLIEEVYSPVARR